ncbi:MAG: nucleotidyltransferase family protein [Candidatus Aminicenantaceae bacterium]
MKIEFYSEKKLKREILEILARHLDLNDYKVFFFGSRVKETNFPRSDVDIGIEGPDEIPPPKFLAIKEELDNLPTLYSFDLVDFKNVPPDFKKETLKNVEPIN